MGAQPVRLGPQRARGSTDLDALELNADNVAHVTATLALARTLPGADAGTDLAAARAEPGGVVAAPTTGPHAAA